jgi:hypothetical protein
MDEQDPHGSAAAIALSPLEGENAPLPLHPLEELQPDEARWLREASELMQRKQRRVTEQMNDGLVRRAAHAKTTGLVRAQFEICDSEYAVGLFQMQGRGFDAVVRVSSATERVNPDGQRDARGIAISVDLSNLSGRWLGHVGRQDFLLFNHPVFVAPNVRALVRLLSLLEISDRHRLAWQGLRFALSRDGLEQLWNLVRSVRSRPRHPLAPTFHSAVPYQLGSKYIAKYSVAPSAPEDLEPSRDMTSRDFLWPALEHSLHEGVSLDFFVHVLAIDHADEQRTKQLRRAVEDAMLDWSRLGARRAKVATIRIGPQAESVAARALAAEQRAFNPWNSLEEHRPLGSLNRARRVAYPDSAANRGAAARATGDASPAPGRGDAAGADGGPGSEAAE